MTSEQQFLRKHYGTKPWISVYAGYGLAGKTSGVLEYGHNLISKATLLDKKAPEFLHVTFCGCFIVDEDKITKVQGVLIYYVWDTREVVKIDKSVTVKQMKALLADKGNCKDSCKLLSQPDTFKYVIEAKEQIWPDYTKLIKEHKHEVDKVPITSYSPSKFEIDNIAERNATAAKSYQYNAK